jgi:TPR repeat protein
MFNYGFCFHKGEGVSKNQKEGVYWYKKSAELGNTSGMVAYGLCLQNGHGICQDLQEGFLYFLKAHQLRAWIGTYHVILCILYGKGTDHCPLYAYFLWKDLSLQTFNMAYKIQGEFFIEVTLFGYSYSKAFEFFDLITDETKLIYPKLDFSINIRLKEMVQPNEQLLKKTNCYRITKNGKGIKVCHVIVEEWPDELQAPFYPLPDNSKKFKHRERFLQILARFQRNPTNVSLSLTLATLYFKGMGTFQDLTKAKLFFKKAHLKKSDDGTFGLLACMKKQNESPQSRFEVCLQRKDTSNSRLLFRIGKGLIQRSDENQSILEEGISFLEKSVFRRYPKAPPFLCLTLLKQRFGFDKSPTELFSMSRKFKDSQSLNDRVYFGVCLFLGIGTKLDQYHGMFIIDLYASQFSKVCDYF